MSTKIAAAVALSAAVVTSLPPVYTKIIQAELVEILLGIRGAKVISFTANTEVSKMRKTGNPFDGQIHKHAKVVGMVNFHYAEGVLRRLEKEGKSADDFRQGESWHRPVLSADDKLTPLCHHKDDENKLYLRFMLQGNVESELRWNHDNSALTDSQNDAVKAFIPTSKPYANQGLENPLKFLVYGLDTIKTASIDGEKYMIVG